MVEYQGMFRSLAGAALKLGHFTWMGYRAENMSRIREGEVVSLLGLMSPHPALMIPTSNICLTR